MIDLAVGLSSKKKVLKTNVVSLVFLQLKDFVNSKYGLAVNSVSCALIF